MNDQNKGSNPKPPQPKDLGYSEPQDIGDTERDTNNIKIIFAATRRNDIIPNHTHKRQTTILQKKASSILSSEESMLENECHDCGVIDDITNYCLCNKYVCELCFNEHTELEIHKIGNKLVIGESVDTQIAYFKKQQNLLAKCKRWKEVEAFDPGRYERRAMLITAKAETLLTKICAETEKYNISTNAYLEMLSQKRNEISEILVRLERSITELENARKSKCSIFLQDNYKAVYKKINTGMEEETKLLLEKYEMIIEEITKYIRDLTSEREGGMIALSNFQSNILRISKSSMIILVALWVVIFVLLIVFFGLFIDVYWQYHAKK